MGWSPVPSETGRVGLCILQVRESFLKNKKRKRNETLLVNFVDNIFDSVINRNFRQRHYLITL